MYAIIGYADTSTSTDMPVHICKTCGRRNHLKSMCRSKNDKPKSNPKHKQSEPQKSHSRGNERKLNQVNADSSDGEDEHDTYSYVTMTMTMTMK